MKNRIYIICLGMLLSISQIMAQETINANDPNSFVFGGDQKKADASIELQPLILIDIEPEGQILVGTPTDEYEAGLPVTGGGLPENLWINYTYRAYNGKDGDIYVSTNMPVPKDMKLKVEIVEVGVGGVFDGDPKRVDLGQGEKTIIKDISVGYTGDGVNRGYRLKYTLENDNGGSLPSGFQVIYRIEEH